MPRPMISRRPSVLAAAANQAVDIALHHPLQNTLRDRAQHVALIMLL